MFPERTGSKESPQSWVGHSGSPTAPHHGLLSLQLAGSWGPRLGYAFPLYMLAGWPSLWVLCVYTLSECVCPVGGWCVSVYVCAYAWGSGREMKGWGGSPHEAQFMPLSSGMAGHRLPASVGDF